MHNIFNALFPNNTSNKLHRIPTSQRDLIVLWRMRLAFLRQSSLRSLADCDMMANTVSYHIQ